MNKEHTKIKFTYKDSQITEQAYYNDSIGAKVYRTNNDFVDTCSMPSKQVEDYINNMRRDWQYVPQRVKRVEDCYVSSCVKVIEFNSEKMEFRNFGEFLDCFEFEFLDKKPMYGSRLKVYDYISNKRAEFIYKSHNEHRGLNYGGM